MAFFSFSEFWQSVSGLVSSENRKSNIVDRRQKPRRIYMQDGYLTFPHRPAYPATLCLIRDISPIGARVELNETVPESDLFLGSIRLFIPLKKHERDCEIAWRDDRLIGFKFIGPKRPPSREYRHPTQRGGGQR